MTSSTSSIRTPGNFVPFNATTVKNLDVTKSEDRSKVTNFIRSREPFVSTDEQKMQWEFICLKLDKKITEIKNRTDGILNFFKYLFQWRLGERSKLQKDVRDMTELKSIIESVKLSQGQMPTAQTTKTPVKTPVVGTPSQATPTTGAVPQSPGTPPGDIPMAPPLDGIPPAPSLNDIPPPPPFASMVANIAFANEPQEPNLQIAVAPNTPPATIQREINQITTFINQMTTALNPIEHAINREQELRDRLVKMNKDAQTLESTIMDLRGKQRILMESTSVSYLNYTQRSSNGDEKIFQVPFYSAEEFTRVNATRARPLPRSFLKSEALQNVNNELTKLTKLDTPEIRQTKEIERQNILRDLETIRRTQNNGINFNDFQDTLRTKRETLENWERALRLRNSQLKKPSAPLRLPRATIGQNATPAPTGTVKPKDREVLELLEKDVNIAALFFGGRANFYDKLSS